MTRHYTLSPAAKLARSKGGKERVKKLGTRGRGKDGRFKRKVRRRAPLPVSSVI